jgi:hypothetical protein
MIGADYEKLTPDRINARKISDVLVFKGVAACRRLATAEGQ